MLQQRDAAAAQVEALAGALRAKEGGLVANEVGGAEAAGAQITGVRSLKLPPCECLKEGSCRGRRGRQRELCRAPCNHIRHAPTANRQTAGPLCGPHQARAQALEEKLRAANARAASLQRQLEAAEGAGLRGEGGQGPALARASSPAASGHSRAAWAVRRP
jgi:hypothetical protein